MPYADLSDVRCYYELLGTGDPLLLIPGLGMTNVAWESAAGLLSKSFTLILPDNRGVGRSVGRRPAHSISDFSVDCVELLDALDVERAHVLGLSFGGIVAQQFAVDHPSRVDRLVLVSCAHRLGPFLMGMAGLLAHALRYFPREVFQRTLELLGTSPEFLDAHPDALQQQVEAARRREVPARMVARQLRCIGCSQIAKEFYRISAPTLVLAGERDGVIPSCYGKQMADEIPGSRFELLTGCGHNPLMEDPERVVPILTDFLQETSLDAAVDRMRRHEFTHLFREDRN